MRRDWQSRRSKNLRIPSRSRWALDASHLLIQPNLRVGIKVRRWALAWPVGLFYLLVVAIAVLLAVNLSFSRKQTVNGEMVPQNGLAEIVAPRDGVVLRLFVENGDVVRRGQIIATISVDVQTESGKDVGDMLAESAKAKDLALHDKLRSSEVGRRVGLTDIAIRQRALRAKIALLLQSRSFAEERVRLAEDRLIKSKPLVEKGFVSELQFQQWADAVNANRINVSELDERCQDAQRELDQLTTEAQQLNSKSLDDRANSEVARADFLATKAAALEQHAALLTASTDGRIAALNVRVGGAVRAGQAIAKILPTGSNLEAQVWVPSSAIGFIRKGDQAKLMFDAFPYQTFGLEHGRVEGISGAPTEPQDVALGSLREPSYLVRIKPRFQAVSAFGRKWPLLPGMKVQADIVLERRSAFHWLLEPFYTFSTRQEDAR